jgi:hypothetical protein
MSTTPTPPPGGQDYGPPRSGQATTILILGIISILCCQILGPIAWYMGRQELGRIRAGLIALEDEGTTKAGMILGIISTILLGLVIIWVIFFGGLAILSAVMEGL